MAKIKGKGILHGLPNFTLTGTVLIESEKQSTGYTKNAAIFNEIRQFDGETTAVAIADEREELTCDFICSGANIAAAQTSLDNLLSQSIGQKFTIAGSHTAYDSPPWILVDYNIPETNVEVSRATLNLRRYSTDISDDAPATP